MKPLHKRSLLAVGLLATVAAAWFVPPDVPAAPAGDGAQRSPVAGAHAQAAPADLDVAPIRRRDLDDEEELDERLFSPVSWSAPIALAPAPAPAAVAPPAGPAQAPPLPFRVLGQYQEAGSTVVFLQFGVQNFLARVGDTIAEHYKVESLQGNSMTLRYIPLDQVQTLEVGGR